MFLISKLLYYYYNYYSRSSPSLFWYLVIFFFSSTIFSLGIIIFVLSNSSVYISLSCFVAIFLYESSTIDIFFSKSLIFRWSANFSLKLCVFSNCCFAISICIDNLLIVPTAFSLINRFCSCSSYILSIAILFVPTISYAFLFSSIFFIPFIC